MKKYGSGRVSSVPRGRKYDTGRVSSVPRGRKYGSGTARKCVDNPHPQQNWDVAHFQDKLLMIFWRYVKD